jgi:hypothetical protein
MGAVRLMRRKTGKSVSKQKTPKAVAVSKKGFAGLGRYQTSNPKIKPLAKNRNKRHHKDMNIETSIAGLAKVLKVSQARLIDVLLASGLMPKTPTRRSAKTESVEIEPEAYATLVAFDALRAAGVPERNVPDDLVRGLPERLAELKARAKARLQEMNHG